MKPAANRLWATQLTILLCNIVFLSFTAHADNPSARVVLLQGEVFAQKGTIEFARLAPGKKIRMGFNKRYMGGSPEPIHVVVDPGPEKDRLELETSPLFHKKPVPALPKPLRTSPVQLSQDIPESSLIATGSASYLKLHLPDNTLLDVGPETALTLEHLRVNASNTPGAQGRSILIKLAYGKLRIHSTAPIRSTREFQIETPSTVTSLRRSPENEILLVSRFEPGPTAISEITTLKGLSTIDYPLYTKEGLVFYQTVVLQQLQKIKISGPHGFGTDVSQETLKDSAAVRDVILTASPKVNARATAALQRPTAPYLPGTYVLPSKTPPPPLKNLERIRQPRCSQNMNIALWHEC